MINSVCLTGRLTKDVELQKTGKGTSVVNFTVAVDDRLKGQNGEKTSSFLNCRAFGGCADILAKYTHKGSLVGVEGYLYQKSGTNKEGKNFNVTYIVVDNIALLEPKKGEKVESDEEPTTTTETGNTDDDLTAEDLPF